MRTWSFAMVTDYCQRSSLAQPRFLFWFPRSLLWAAPGLRDSAVFTVLLCFSALGLRPRSWAPASLERGGPSLLRGHEPELGPHESWELSSFVRSERKQSRWGAGVSKGSHNRNLESRFFLITRPRLGRLSSHMLTVIFVVRAFGAIHGKLGGGGAVGTRQVQIAGGRNMCPLSWGPRRISRDKKNSSGDSQVAQMVKNLPAVQETQVPSPGPEDPLEKGMATHSSILAWRIPWQRSLVGYSPWGHKESGTTEPLTLAVLRFFHCRLFQALGVTEGKVGGEDFSQPGLVNPAGLSNPCKMVL